MAVVSGMLIISRPKQLPQCAISIEPEELNGGDIRQALVPYEFTVRNQSSGPVNIRALPSTCSCNETRFSKSVLQPNETATLSGELDGKQFRSGKMRVPVRIEYDCGDQVIQAQAMFAGTIVPHVAATPEFVRFREHDEPQQRVVFTTNYPPDIEIVKVSCVNSDIAVSVDPNTKNAIVVRTSPELKNTSRDLSIRHAEVIVQTTSQAASQYKVPVTYIGVRETAPE